MSKLEELDPQKVEDALKVIEAAESGDSNRLADVVTGLVIANNPTYAVAGPLLKRALVRALGVLPTSGEDEAGEEKPGIFGRLFGWLW